MTGGRIELRGLRVRGFHGVYAEERRTGQDFVVDAVLTMDLSAAASSDEVADTVHYGELAQALAAVVAGESVNLIETLATRLLDVCLADPRVDAAVVTVHKPAAPIPLTFADVSVTLTRQRSPWPPTSPAPRGSGDLIPDVPTGAPESGEVAPKPGRTAGSGQGRPGFAPRSAVLSIGSNVGDRAGHLRTAVAAFADVLVAVSPVYETPPWGGVEQPSYLNAILLVTGQHPAAYWLGRAHAAEQTAGRERDVRWGPRTLDVDIVAVDGVLATDPALTLPHPHAHERAFVLRPWLDVEPDAVLAGRPIADWWADLGPADVVRRDDVVLS